MKATDRSVEEKVLTSKKLQAPNRQLYPLHTKVDHALVHHKLTLMRDAGCSANKFRRLMNEIALIMGVEVTRDLDTGWNTDARSGVEGILLNGPKVIVVAILRAGLGMSGALIELMPSARVGHIGLHKADDGLIQYLISLPSADKDGDYRTCFIIDPVIGTGSVASRAIEIVKEQNVPGAAIRYVTIVAAAEGLARLGEQHPDVRVFYAEQADSLDTNLHVVPHWGDASNRLYGIK